jgi:hypothetical protein
MQIVVTDVSVQVYMHGADLGNCGCNAVTFPAVDSCSFLTDASPCNVDPYCRSCITDFGVVASGQPLTPSNSGGADPLTRYYETLPAGDLFLWITGCGHPTTLIPLDGPAFPQTSATADYVNGVPTVSWTAGTSTLSTLLTLSSGTHGELCNATGSAYTFAGWGNSSGVDVWPLVSRSDLDTTFGSATVWHAGAASATFPTTQ